jgi:16S rRNA (adenine(1408)-N(1))-methyltransferase
MRQISGERTLELSPAAFGALRERYRSVLLDIGTGDGKHVLHAARH